MVYVRKIACSSLAITALTLSLHSVAHVSVTSGTATAGGYYEVTLAVPHGCDGDDTYKIEVTIPGTFGKIRASDSTFGSAMVETVTDGTTVSSYKVIWEKSEVHENDDIAYNIGFRTKLPDTPFATVYLPAVQYCRDDETQDESISAWFGTSAYSGNPSTRAMLEADPNTSALEQIHPGSEIWVKY